VWCIVVHMTVRLSVSLPDDVHADLLRIAGASNISAGAVIRALLSESLPRLTSVMEFLGTVQPSDVPAVAAELDAWATDLRGLMHDAPDALGSFRTYLDGPTGLPPALPPAGDS